MEIKFNNEHLFRLVNEVGIRRSKELEFAGMRCSKLEEENRNERRQNKQLEHRVWELEKELGCREDELEGVNRRSDIAIAGLKSELQNAQS